ncbi:MAG TPA: VOC family protein [Longimicrobium sp.]
MQANRSIPDVSIIPELAYDDVRAAARWLCDAFGFRERLRISDHRVQLTFGNGALVVRERREGESVPGSGHSVMVRVEDADAHCARAREHGARIVGPPADYPFGERQYSAVDLAGHAWTFTQSITDVDPASWGGEMVEPT